MKKLFLTLGFIMTLSISGHSQVPSQQNSVPVCLQVKPVEPDLTKGPIRRSPAMAPSLSLEDHTLFFNTSCDGCVLQLVNEDGDVEYDIIIPEDTETLSLPLYLEGEYELQIIRGNYCFYGYIELL